jgi:transcriptional regulator with XRE-family HTH domain
LKGGKRLSYKTYAIARDEKGMTDYAVSKETSIPKSTFSDWKSGRSCPKTEKLMKIAKCLEKPLEYFVD